MSFCLYFYVCSLFLLTWLFFGTSITFAKLSKCEECHAKISRKLVKDFNRSKMSETISCASCHEWAHTSDQDVEKASYYEDMYVQASEHFPGILLDVKKRSVRFSLEKFIIEIEETLNHFDELD